ncbi:hypothetical protein FS935_17030 [Metabacillus litoralis]|uniref:Uncharacterized protein n=1 Tax=Metabacillus litoralis TaxID=152268 RepID=A0A5C6VYB0_9BACI|nr:hypothetical protein [Metabacillus litoralis]TXC89581.1 hypothetical protein FS935_17030 [Metabacillus litoralis]
MSRIRTKGNLFETQFAKDFIKGTLNFLSTSLIILLEKGTCSRLALGNEFSFNNANSIKVFHDAQYKIGFYHQLGVPVVGLHFKPSEQFFGLGGSKVNSDGKSHGSYATKSEINFMGNEIKKK